MAVDYIQLSSTYQAHLCFSRSKEILYETAMVTSFLDYLTPRMHGHQFREIYSPLFYFSPSKTHIVRCLTFLILPLTLSWPVYLSIYFFVIFFLIYVKFHHLCVPIIILNLHFGYIFIQRVL